MSPAQTIKTEEIFRQTLNAPTQARQPNKQTVEKALRQTLAAQVAKNFKQQRQQSRLKSNLIFNLPISREFRFIYFVYISQTEIVRQRQISKKEFGLVKFTTSRICRMWLFHVVA